MMGNLLRKDVALNARLLWGLVPLLLWLGFALREPDLTFATSGVIMAFAGTLSACLIGAREDKFKAQTVLLSLPVTRAAVIRARYASALVVGLACFAAVSVMAVWLPWSARPAAEVFDGRTQAFAVASIVATAAVMLPFALRFGLVGVIGLMGVFQVGGIVVLLWSEVSGRRGAARAVFGSIESGLTWVFLNLDRPGFVLGVAAVLVAGLWASVRLAVFLSEHQDV